MTSGLLRTVGIVLTLASTAYVYRQMYLLTHQQSSSCFSSVNLSHLGAPESKLLHPYNSLEEQLYAKGIPWCSNVRIICIPFIILTTLQYNVERSNWTFVGHLSHSTSHCRSAATATDNFSMLLLFLYGFILFLSRCYCSLYSQKFKAGTGDMSLLLELAFQVTWMHKVQWCLWLLSHHHPQIL